MPRLTAHDARGTQRVGSTERVVAHTVSHPDVVGRPAVLGTPVSSRRTPSVPYGARSNSVLLWVLVLSDALSTTYLTYTWQSSDAGVWHSNSEINDVSYLSGTIPSELETRPQLTELYDPACSASVFAS
jgi:hypothetical protein